MSALAGPPSPVSEKSCKADNKASTRARELCNTWKRRMDLILVSVRDDRGILLRELCFPKHLVLTWEEFVSYVLSCIDAASKILFPYYMKKGTDNLFWIDPSHWTDYLPFLSEVVIKCHTRLIISIVLESTQDRAATLYSDSESESGSEKLEDISTTEDRPIFRREAARTIETCRDISISQLRIHICRLFEIREPDIRKISMAIGHDRFELDNQRDFTEFLVGNDQEELDLIVQRR